MVDQTPPELPVGGPRNINTILLPPKNIIHDALSTNVVDVAFKQGLLTGRQICVNGGHAFTIYQDAAGWVRNDDVYEMRVHNLGTEATELLPLRTVVLDVEDLVTRPEFLSDVPGQLSLVGTLNNEMSNSMAAYANIYRQDLLSLSPAQEKHRSALELAYQDHAAKIPTYTRAQHQAFQRFFDLASQTSEVDMTAPIYQEAYQRLLSNMTVLDELGK